MPSSEPTKSVALLIPCFNGLQHLPALLEQVEKADDKFNEIIVYDDASTEPLPFKPEEKFPHVRFHQGEVNKGSGFARNRLIELSTSNYLHFHDIDDTYFPSNFLSGLKPHLKPNTVVFSSWEIHWPDHHKEIQKFDYPNFNSVEDFCKFFIRGHIHLNAAIYPRDIALKTKFNEGFRVMQDLVFNIDLACNGAKFLHNADVVTRHTKNELSTLGKIQSDKFLDYRVKYCQYCLQKLPKHLSPLMRDSTLHFAWNAYLQNSDRQANALIDAAKQSGPLQYTQFGKVVSSLAPLIGLKNALRIRKSWFNFVSRVK